MLASIRHLTCAVAAAAALASAAPASAQIALKFGHIVGTDHAIHIGATAMGEHIGKCSNGSLKLDIFPGGQLGNESALIDQTKLGGVDFANTGAGFLSRNYAPLGISSLPYAFRDRDHALAYAKSPVLRELMDNWEKASGQILLGAYYSAAFHVYAQEGFEKPEQIKGKKIRVPDAPAWMVFFRAVGANPVPMALGEVYLGLRQGVIDGTNMPLAVGFSTKLHEVSKVINMTYHQMEIAMLVSGPILKGRLNAAQWKCVEEAGKIYAATAEKEIVRSEDALRTEMTQKNLVKFVDVDVAAYRAATASVIADRVKAGEFPQSLVDRINAVK